MRLTEARIRQIVRGTLSESDTSLPSLADFPETIPPALRSAMLSLFRQAIETAKQNPDHARGLQIATELDRMGGHIVPDPDPDIERRMELSNLHQGILADLTFDPRLRRTCIAIASLLQRVMPPSIRDAYDPAEAEISIERRVARSSLDSVDTAQLFLDLALHEIYERTMHDTFGTH